MRGIRRWPSSWAAPSRWRHRPSCWRAAAARRCLGTPIELPDRFTLTPRLVGGAALFGAGWGLSGICPGPGIVLAGSLEGHALVFLAAAIAGSFLADRVGARGTAKAEPGQGRGAGWAMWRRAAPARTG